MGNKEDNKFSSFSKKFITWLGYFWIILSVAIAIWQIIDFLFPIEKYQINDYAGWLVGGSVLIGSCVVAALLTVFFPSILDIIDGIFDKRPEDARYFKITPMSERDNLAATIYASLPYIENEKFLLLSIKDACGLNSNTEHDYMRALNIGRANSSLLHRLDKNYLRVLNGLYAIYALEKRTGASKRKGRYIFYKNFFVINDIGWSLTKLTDAEFNDLQNFLSVEKDNFGILLYDTIRKAFEFDWTKSAYDNGEKLIINARRELKDTNFHTLYVQSLRHCLSFEHCRELEQHDLLKTFEKAIKLIRNSHDRVLMRGNMEFLEATIKYNAINDPIKKNNYTKEVLQEQIQQALDLVSAAQKAYLRIDDMARFTKCFNLIGNLRKESNDYDGAIKAFEDGLDSAKHYQRYDQVLLNLTSLVQTEQNQENSEKYAKEGLTLAIELKNIKYERIFDQYIRVRHVFLVRHGESVKNIKKTINGEGELTEIGQQQIQDKAEEIKVYLEQNRYDTTQVHIYGHKKQQVIETIDLLKKTLHVDDSFVSSGEELLRPIDMGILANIDEHLESDTDEDTMAALTLLERWRNGMVSAHDLNIRNMEAFDSYWGRAKEFVSRLTANTISIIVCTTSVSVFLTQYLLNPNMSDLEYHCLDVPLGAVIHFAEMPSISNKNMCTYRLVNKDNRTNILFSSVLAN